jgi:hypothetical protein
MRHLVVFAVSTVALVSAIALLVWTRPADSAGTPRRLR